MDASRYELKMWRLLFVIYAIMLEVGIHLPRLDFDSGDYPGPDKSMHLMAYSGLALLLWLTRWIRSVELLGVILFAWVVFDELTQAIPGLERSISMMDAVAGWIGSLLTIMFILASKPVGESLSRSRRSGYEMAFHQALSKGTNWLMLAVSGALGAVVMMPVFILVSGTFSDPNPYQAGMIGIGVGAGLASGAGLLAAMRHQVVSSPDDRFSVLMSGTMPVSEFLSLIFVPVIVCLLILAIPIIPFVLMTSYIGVLSAVPRDMITNIDLLYLGMISSLCLYWSRQRIAARYDRSHMDCIRCGHDIRHVRLEHGEGRCPECGTSFVQPGS
ncbi:MAG: hypothetical protein CMJ32_10065 [Phycisphaerae bacterium]|nr:hypothetical protein [Phycisphaerae bacterium]